MRQPLIPLAMLVLSACTVAPSTSPLMPPPEDGISTSEVDASTDHFTFNEYTSSAWVSEQFSGMKIRQFRGDKLYFGVEQTAPEGGLDVGVSERAFEPTDVRSAKRGLHVCSSYDTDLSGDGRWWAGPKVSVNWQGTEAAKQNGDDWYENYIVEIASSTPQELHEIFTGDYFQAEDLPPLPLARATYRNYKIRFHSWWQFWSVRQDYRATGILNIEPIVDLWIAHGLPSDRTFDGVKANIETYGPVEGYGWLKLSQSNDPAQLNCAN